MKDYYDELKYVYLLNISGYETEESILKALSMNLNIVMIKEGSYVVEALYSWATRYYQAKWSAK